MNSIHFGAIIKNDHLQKPELLLFSDQAGATEGPYRIELSLASLTTELTNLPAGQFGNAYGDWRQTILGATFILKRWQTYGFANWNKDLQKVYCTNNKHRITSWKAILKKGKKFFQPMTFNGVQYSQKETYESAMVILNQLKDYQNHPPLKMFNYFNSITIDGSAESRGLYQSSISQPLIKDVDASFDWIEIANHLAIIRSANEAIYNEVFCKLNNSMI